MQGIAGRNRKTARESSVEELKGVVERGSRIVITERGDRIPTHLEDPRNNCKRGRVEVLTLKTLKRLKTLKTLETLIERTNSDGKYSQGERTW